MKPKLSFEDLKTIVWTLNYYIVKLSNERHDHKCIAHCLLDAKIRTEKKMAGLINEKGYRLKLRPESVEAILHIRNEMHSLLGAETDNAVVRLLEMNK